MPELDYPSRSAGSPSSESQSDKSQELNQDDAFHLLQTNRRRESIRYLLDHEDERAVRMRDIAEHIAAKEHDTTVKQLTSTQRQRVYIPLYQSHLPKLDKKGIIEYEKTRGIVRPGDRLEEIRPYLEAQPLQRESEQPARASASSALPRYYHIALGISLGLLGATVSGLLATPGLFLVTLITGLFALTSAVSILADVLPASETKRPQLRS
ncbi:hypothetical protein Htur_4111 (plasmid) [Haloterrigena turkmenica DSM 5511]|uniref:DUF7344 domain-containing protein n=1 Tax=Haloterrigena turkmenica (strain ATCC 51198 / DSM 5511 / JCM 9101 / NCIMB 13204 / VKM B-1734 / 4k) TaxID=543526 RepID=D2S0P3_HALTV|nr:hypothetical protein [Haloterrigena turkmenica]ADB62940.1 hypothetical protein Htur_4111 [Haloterrigena turkmenica DSM 5511]